MVVETKRAAFPNSLVARAAVPALLVLSFALLTAGCGGKKTREDVQTDPTLLEDVGDGVEDVDMGEQPFGGEPVDEGSVETQDITEPDRARPGLILQDVFFDFDSAELRSEAREVLAADARKLRDDPTARILIEGHCDERGTVQYNLALGERRARAAQRYLTNLGVDASRIDIVSYGKERPFAAGHDEAAWAQNRRAHFVVRGAGR